MQDKVIEEIRYWCGSFNPDGLYFKNMNDIKYRNLTSFEIFIKNIRNTCLSFEIPFKVLIGDYLPNKTENSLYDIYHVRLNSVEMYQHLKQSRDPFSSYLSLNKSVIWSLENFDGVEHNFRSRRDLLIGLYFLIYSLPGICLIKQSDELEYEKLWQKNPKIFRWDDLLEHSGFSNISSNLNWLRSFEKQPQRNLIRTSSQSLLNEFGIDLKHALSDSNSLANFLIYFNQRVKQKLNDIRLVENYLTTTAFPVLNVRLEPFKNSFKSLSEFYLIKSYYGVENSNQVLKITRQINNYSKKSHSAKFYRNVVFLMNLSARSIRLDQVISVPRINKRDLGRNQAPQIPIHVIFDSTKQFPEYIYLNSPKHESFYLLESNSYLCLEY